MKLDCIWNTSQHIIKDYYSMVLMSLSTKVTNPGEGYAATTSSLLSCESKKRGKPFPIVLFTVLRSKPIDCSVLFSG